MKDTPLLNKEVKSKNYASYTDKFNIIMMGEEGVGKTDILKNLSKKKYNKFKNIYIDNNYEKNSNLIKQNINQDILEKISLEYNSEDKNFLIKIWNYCYIINDFMKKADAFIIVYSVKDKNSFNNIERWITEAKNKTSSKKIQFFIIGNNCDEINERQVGIDEIKQFVEKDNYKFFEISSTNKEDLEESFNEIFSDVINIVYSDSDFSELEVERKNKRCCGCCKKCFIF